MHPVLGFKISLMKSAPHAEARTVEKKFKPRLRSDSCFDRMQIGIESRNFGI
jgi:hypothetical protein